MDKYKFGEFIYNRRKQLGLTQDELGRKLKVTNKAVSKWETGETLPDILLLQPLAEILQVSIDELLTFKKPEVEKVYIKPKKYPFIILSSVILVLIISLIAVSTSYFKYKNEKITVDNAINYYSIIPCDQSIIEDKSLTIHGSITPTYEIIDPYLSIDFTIEYYYLNNSDQLCEILFLNRNVVYDGTSNEYAITVSAKNDISDYKCFSNFKINYKISKASGRKTGRINYE